MNKSYIGVKQTKAGNWRARMHKKYIGTFSSAKDAAIAYDNACRQRGKDVPLNFPDSHYNTPQRRLSKRRMNIESDRYNYKRRPRDNHQIEAIGNSILLNWIDTDQFDVIVLNEGTKADMIIRSHDSTGPWMMIQNKCSNVMKAKLTFKHLSSYSGMVVFCISIYLRQVAAFYGSYFQKSDTSTVTLTFQDGNKHNYSKRIIDNGTVIDSQESMTKFLQHVMKEDNKDLAWIQEDVARLPVSKNTHIQWVQRKQFLEFLSNVCNHMCKYPRVGHRHWTWCLDGRDSHRIQDKTSRVHHGRAGKHVNLSTSGRVIPYKQSDFDFLLVWSSNSNYELHGFWLIPMQVLQDRGYITYNGKQGKTVVSLYTEEKASMRARSSNWTSRYYQSIDVKVCPFCS